MNASVDTTQKLASRQGLGDALWRTGLTWLGNRFRLLRCEPLDVRPRAELGHTGFKLLRYFSASSALAFLATGIMFLSVYSWQQEQAIIEAGKGRNVALIQVISKTIWWSHADYLSTVGQVDGEILRDGLETQEINRELRTVLVGLPILKVKIFHPNGKVVYSTDSSQIGGRSSISQKEWDQVRQGEHPVSRVSFRNKFDGLEGEVRNVYVTETYVPLFDSMGDLTAVFELYADMTQEMRSLNGTTWRLATSAIFLFGSLYAVLLLIMRRADSVMRSQHARLHTLNEKLEAESAKTAALNTALEEKLVQLEQSNQDLQDFAHIASHDLQEPLRKIQAFGDRLSKKYGKTLPEDGQMFIDRMQDASSRMRKLITDLLAYSRSTNKQVSFATVDLREIVDGVLSDLQVRIEESKAEFKITPLHAVDADPAQMRQLFQNLIANALKFRKKDTRHIIQITSDLQRSSCQANSPDLLVLKISDNGVGFDPAQTHKLFKVFHRLHGRSVFEGSGIGLATCRKIVERHGGTIEAEGQINVGATFTVTLPLRHAGYQLHEALPARPIATVTAYTAD